MSEHTGRCELGSASGGGQEVHLQPGNVQKHLQALVLEQSDQSASTLEPSLGLEQFFVQSEVFFEVQDNLVEQPHPMPSMNLLSSQEVHQTALAILATVTHIKSN